MASLLAFQGSASTEQGRTAIPSVILTSPFQSAHLMWTIPIINPTSSPSEKCDHNNNNVHPTPKIRFADIGCGFGGLLVSLSTIFPDTLMIGMELRDKVTEYVKELILALRASNPGQYENISVVRTNSMKYLPNYFGKAQLTKMFFLFPDPHFKEKNHRRRVISRQLLDEYAYALEIGGIIYTITDVEELGDWMRSCLEDHPLFTAHPGGRIGSRPSCETVDICYRRGSEGCLKWWADFHGYFQAYCIQD